MRTRHALGAGTVILAALAAALAGCGGGSPAAVPSTVAVDFARPIANKSMSGFLLAVNETTPPDSKILPLRPKFWRTGAYQTLYARTTGFGARFCVNCSDVWGYQVHPAPFENYPAYADRMKKIVTDLNSRPAIYDLWNEPDTAQFWHGSRIQFFETFKVAHDAIRAEQPDAHIAGPSISAYNHDYIQDFLNYCLGKGIKLDVLTWHEFRDGASLPQISQSLQEARRDFVDNPAYAALGIKEIQINEAIGQSIQFKPGSSLAVLDQLERGGADASSHACWPDGKGSNCDNQSLDGLLTPKFRETRSAWWAYKAYADGAASRVASASDNPRVYALASRESRSPTQAHGPAQVIAGVYGGAGGDVTLVLNHVSALPSLAGAASVNVTFQRIPNHGDAALNELPPPTTVAVPVAADSVTAPLKLNSEEVAVVTLTP